MSPLRLIIAAFLHHWRMNLAVALGAAVGTAVLTGALLVGDSMRGSLRHLALDRLGRIDEALVTDRFFDVHLADDYSNQDADKKKTTTAVPAIILSTSMENPKPRGQLRANRVQLIGCDNRFWQLGKSPAPAPFSKAREIILNRPLAEKLSVKPGDRVVLQLPRLGAIPAETAMGQKRDTVQSVRLKVREVIPAEGLGRFGLKSTQHLPLNAFVSLELLQDLLDQPDRANAIIVQLQESEQSAINTDGSQLQKMLRPKLSDLGLNVAESPRGYVNITSDEMILNPSAEKEIRKAIGNEQTKGLVIQPAFTNMAITIADGEMKIPYSTITAIDFVPALKGTVPFSSKRKSGQSLDTTESPLGPFLSPEGKPLPPLKDGEIALISWAVDDLKAKIGDKISVTYFEPESTEGRMREITKQFRLAAVVQMTDAADDRELTPPITGITDKDTMEWDSPFPCDPKLVRKQDEKYWDDHGPTPKAFISLAEGRRLWSSRFGNSTSLRLALPAELTLEDLEKKLSAVDPVAFGFVFQPIKQQALAAAAGTTPFNVLFLAFSFFIIAAAVMLIMLLFRLGVEQRARQIGILLAVGLKRKQVRRILLGEGFCTAVAGSLLGVPVGIAYAAMLLLGLRTWWLAAVVTPFLQLYITPLSLIIGMTSGILIATAAIAISVRSISRIEPRRLLAGQTSIDSSSTKTVSLPFSSWTELSLLTVLALTILGLFLIRIREDFQPAAFFGGGAIVLLVSLGLVWIRLRSGRTGPAMTLGGGNILRLALRNAARKPGRSELTIALMSAATFLIVAVSAFRIDTRQQIPTLASGNGGFSLVAESDQPIYQNFNTPQGREELGFTVEDEPVFAQSTAIALRVKPGDDASCLNLYRPGQPRLLGVPQKMIDRGGFVWADMPGDCPNFCATKMGLSPSEQHDISAAKMGLSSLHGSKNPWLLLKNNLGHTSEGVPIIPVILEKNTANYSLNLWKGIGETFDISDGQGGKIRLQVVALLGNSIFQGDLLVDETALLKYFPEVSGYRFFLFETPPDNTAVLQKLLERTLGDYGFTSETTGQRLAEFLAVQNTYLSTFQSLGGLGLLLGTLGLAAVQLRNVVERRGELALMRAAGFRRRTLAGLVILENVALLSAGLICGILAAVVAILPHLLHHTASIPWLSLAITLSLVITVGLLTGLIAANRVLRAPLLAALREEK